MPRRHGNYAEDAMRSWKEREHALVEENHRIRSELAQQPDATRSTVMNARIIDDFHGVPYPDGVQRPPISVSSKSNPLHYDRGFLLQFQRICTDVPESLLSTGLPITRLFDTAAQTSIKRFGGIPSVIRPGGPSGTQRPTQRSGIGKNKANSSLSKDTPALNVAIMPETSPDTQSLSQTATKVMTLVHELTAENFAACSDEIVNCLNQSGQFSGDALNHIALSIIDRATSSEAHSEVCARLCDKMMAKINPLIQSDILNAQGKPMKGSQLLRRYLMKGCKDRWQDRATSKLGLASSPSVQGAGGSEKDTVDEWVVVTPDESPTSTKITSPGWNQRRILLVRFVGELFKLRHVTEKMVLREYIKEPLTITGGLDETDIESVCVLLASVGRKIDFPRNSSLMEASFARLAELAADPRLDTRINSLVEDVIDLRSRKWDVSGRDNKKRGNK